MQVRSPEGMVALAEWSMEGRRLRVKVPFLPDLFTLEPGPLPGDVEDIMRRHVERIVAHCRESGSRCVILTYPGGPYAKRGLNDNLKRVAAHLGVAVIDMEPVFAAAGKEAPAEALYVVDGHCSDLGYGKIAAAVYRHAVAVLR